MPTSFGEERHHVSLPDSVACTPPPWDVETVPILPKTPSRPSLASGMLMDDLSTRIPFERHGDLSKRPEHTGLGDDEISLEGLTVKVLRDELEHFATHGLVDQLAKVVDLALQKHLQSKDSKERANVSFGLEDFLSERIHAGEIRTGNTNGKILKTSPRTPPIAATAYVGQDESTAEPDLEQDQMSQTAVPEGENDTMQARKSLKWKSVCRQKWLAGEHRDSSKVEQLGYHGTSEASAVGDELFRSTLRESGPKFTLDIIVSILILVNAIIMILQYEYQGYLVGVTLGMYESESHWKSAGAWFFAFEHIFNVIFMLECFVRCSVLRWSFFRDWSNLLDALLVIANSIYLYWLEPWSEVDGVNVSLLRLVRIFKGMKVLRVGRLMKVVRELRILLAAINSSINALIWALVLLSVFITIAAIFLCHMLQPMMVDTRFPEVDRLWAYNYYGTSVRSIYTMFEVTMSGCWPNYARTLIENVSPMYGVFFFLYVAVVVFAVIRIITAIFLKETLNAANNDAEMAVTEQTHIKSRYVSKLTKVFEAADTSGDKQLSLEEFLEIIDNPKVRTWLQVLEVEVHEAESLFKLLDDGDGLLDSREFLDGILKVKGNARAIDVISMQRQLSKVLRILENQNAMTIEY